MGREKPSQLTWGCSPWSIVRQYLGKRPMANKHPHPVRNGIIATVVGGLILSSIPQSRGFLLEVMSWAWAGVSWIWVALISHYSIPGWVFLIVGLFALVGLVQPCVVLWRQNEPTYRNYTEDMLYGAKWRWSWSGGQISNLWCFCPRCDAQLIYDVDYLHAKTDFICEQCSPDESDYTPRSHGRVVATVKGGGRDYAVGAVGREVLRRIRTGEAADHNTV